jgi:hypothetical protein
MVLIYFYLGNKLKIPLECYLTLSCTKKMGIKILRIDDVK